MKVGKIHGESIGNFVTNDNKNNGRWDTPLFFHQTKNLFFYSSPTFRPPSPPPGPQGTAMDAMNIGSNPYGNNPIFNMIASAASAEAAAAPGSGPWGTPPPRSMFIGNLPSTVICPPSPANKLPPGGTIKATASGTSFSNEKAR